MKKKLIFLAMLGINVVACSTEQNPQTDVIAIPITITSASKALIGKPFKRLTKHQTEELEIWKKAYDDLVEDIEKPIAEGNYNFEIRAIKVSELTNLAKQIRERISPRLIRDTEPLLQPTKRQQDERFKKAIAPGTPYQHQNI